MNDTGIWEGKDGKHLYNIQVPSIATNVHYKPLPMMTAYKAKGLDIKDYPNAYKFFENEITLPLNTKMTEEDVEYIIENLLCCLPK